jgi:hypothetical protein
MPQLNVPPEPQGLKQTPALALCTPPCSPPRPLPIRPVRPGTRRLCASDAQADAPRQRPVKMGGAADVRRLRSTQARMMRRHRLSMTPPQTTQGRDAGHAATPAAMSSERVREGVSAGGAAARGWTGPPNTAGDGQRPGAVALAFEQHIRDEVAPHHVCQGKTWPRR